MTPPIVYEIAHTLLPKKFTMASISAHPDFQKNSHRDMVLQAVLKLIGLGASNRIPSMLRKQPKLFFQGFEQLRARAAKVAKEDPDLGMTEVAVTDDKAAVAKAGAESQHAHAKAELRHADAKSESALVRSGPELAAHVGKETYVVMTNFVDTSLCKVLI